MRWPEGLKMAVSETGEFQIDGLNPSEYNVIATADGHRSIQKAHVGRGAAIRD